MQETQLPLATVGLVNLNYYNSVFAEIAGISNGAELQTTVNKEINTQLALLQSIVLNIDLGIEVGKYISMAISIALQIKTFVLVIQDAVNLLSSYPVSFPGVSIAIPGGPTIIIPPISTPVTGAPPGTPPGTPIAPPGFFGSGPGISGLQINGPTSNSFTLQWNAAGGTNYDSPYKKSSDWSWNNLPTIMSPSPVVTSPVTGLNDNSEYSVRVPPPEDRRQRAEHRHHAVGVWDQPRRRMEPLSAISFQQRP